jgi:hypothetical protein
MMSFKSSVLSCFAALWLFGCASSKPIVLKKNTTDTDPYSNYDEDLAVVRPRYKEPSAAEVSPKKPETRPTTSSQPLHINRQLDAATDTIAAQNRAIRYAAGYRIQIYVGNVRQEADDARLYTYQTFPELNPYLQYSPPTYRIRIGDFMTRIDAERYLQRVKERYEAAVILAEKIELKKSLLVK